ncbi:hypothetical protein THIAE_03940 [Thiomicrospira aerophila AL3]|uniref:Cache domain-containing protein n=1 Tax=Thiomicrospira aerophila AL3 TaxID=717772 RepID=W0DUW4_9GAMM|nr:cache domain-containing protein [Thiomicrospira aerophila]AHF02217.1 hypothetical protein THIAE_03940 [Thiomicrospira aerophila AL3]
MQSQSNEHNEHNAILTKLIAGLPEIKNYLSELESQDLWWTTVAMVGKINNQNIDPQLLVSIVETQVEFQKLRDKMMSSLIERYESQAKSDLQLKTQAIIDIINRNLFERTADVGFLAEDLVIKDYLRVQHPDKSDNERIQQRLTEYAAKYTVYKDIALVKPDHSLAYSLKYGNKSLVMHDLFLQDRKLQQGQFVEHFGPCSLYDDEKRVLLYIQAIRKDSQVLGYLILHFRFYDEMNGIFKTLNLGNTQYKMRLTHNDGETLASNDSIHYPLYKKTGKPKSAINPSVHQSSLTLARTTKGYEGFMGLPWLSEASLDVKSAIQQHKPAELNHSLNYQINSQSPLFLHELTETNLMVKNLLLIVILNGKINSLKREVSAFLPVLESFQEISQNISDTFNRFIHHLHSVILKIVLTKLENSALLSAEIMDRNLYERANDVRWWALNDRLINCLKANLSNSSEFASLQVKAQQTLLTINNLYTVYTNLLLIDHNHNIIAVSNPEESKWLGQKFEHKTDLEQCFKVSNSQAYFASNFKPSPYYGDKPTYIYYAPIKDPEKNSNLGAIAIVFDSAPQFKAILKDFAPDFMRHELKTASFNAFINSKGQVISSNTDLLQAGQQITLPAELGQFSAGKQGLAEITLGGTAFICRFFMSKGYREFKNADGYNNYVIALAAIKK